MKKISAGFTLIELLIYIAVVSTVLVILTSLIVDFLVDSEKSLAMQEVQQNARIAMARMVHEIRSANDLNVGSSTFNTHPGVLSLSMDTGSLSPTVFDVVSEKLRITQGIGSPLELTNNKVRVTNFVVKNRSVTSRTKIVSIDLTVAHVNPSGSDIFDAQISLRSSVVLREQED